MIKKRRTKIEREKRFIIYKRKYFALLSSCSRLLHTNGESTIKGPRVLVKLNLHTQDAHLPHVVPGKL